MQVNRTMMSSLSAETVSAVDGRNGDGSNDTINPEGERLVSMGLDED